MAKFVNLTINFVQTILTTPLGYTDYFLRLHNGLQWEYLKTIKIESKNMLRWNQIKMLNLKGDILTIQLVGSVESSMQIVYSL